MVGFVLFGALYAVAATACVVPVFLAVAVQSLTLSPAGTVGVFAAYAGSFGLLMTAVTVATAVGYGVGAGRLAGYVDRATTLAGVLLVLAGVGQLYVAV